MFVLIVRNDSSNEAMEASLLLYAYFSTSGIDCVHLDSSALYGCGFIDLNDVLEGRDPDLAVVLGGDGTILQTARIMSDRDCPILGINFGHLGFLANDSSKGVIPLVVSALAGEMREECRSNLRIEAVCDEDFEAERSAAVQDGVDLACAQDVCAKDRKEFFALNEVSVERGDSGRMLDLSFSISDTHIADIRGNGIIVASSTGSTAYALGAGGPLVTPAFNGLIIQPIAPHTLVSRAILADSNEVVHISLGRDSGDRSATIFTDGTRLVFDKPVTDIYVMRGYKPTRLLYDEGNHFYRYAAEKFFNSCP